MPCTIVLVHGAFAERANWDAVVESLCQDVPAPQAGVMAATRRGRIIALKGASHASAVSRPDAVTRAILDAVEPRVAV